MKIKNILCTLLAAAAVLTAFSGCSAMREKKNSELNIAIKASPATMDPQLASDTNSGRIISLFTCTLYMYDETNTIVPGLAESMEWSDDNLTATYHLKEGIRWSDGSPITADDFVYAFKHLADPETASNAVYLITSCCIIENAAEISKGECPVSELGVTAVDHGTFQVKLEAPCPYLNSLLSMPDFAPRSKSFCETVGDDNYALSAKSMLSSGAFVPDMYEPLAAQIHMKKNPYYVFADESDLPGVNIQIVSDSQQTMMCFETGVFDIIPVGGDVYELADGDACLHEYPIVATDFIKIDCKTNKPLQNKNIRMALSKVIDRESIAVNVLRTGYKPLYAVSPPGYFKETDGTDFYGDGSRYLEYAGYDTEKALELWKQGLDEIGASSVKVGLSYNSSNSALAEAIEAQAEKALPGCEIVLNPVTQKEYLKMSSSGEGFDLLICGWAADYGDPTSFLNIFLGGTGKNIYSSEEFDSLLDKADESEAINTPGMRNDLLHQAEDILLSDAALIPLFSVDESYLVRDGVTGFAETPTASFNIKKLDKEVR